MKQSGESRMMRTQCLYYDLERWQADELFTTTQPAHLQKVDSEKLSAEERELIRADMLRDGLKDVSRPRAR